MPKSCPKCDYSPCAEFAQMGKAPQWKCHRCGAEGQLTGLFDARPSKPPQAPKPSKPWPFPTSKIALAGILLLLGCAPPPSHETAIDPCLLRVYLAECHFVAGAEGAACRRRVVLEAIRPVGGILEVCLPEEEVV